MGITTKNRIASLEWEIREDVKLIKELRAKLEQTSRTLNGANLEIEKLVVKNVELRAELERVRQLAREALDCYEQELEDVPKHIRSALRQIAGGE